MHFLARPLLYIYNKVIDADICLVGVVALGGGLFNCMEVIMQ